MSLLLIWAYWQSVRLPAWITAFALLLDVLALNGVIALYGAASNPFNAVLLAPVVLAFVLLPVTYAGGVLLISMLAQGAQLLLLPEHHHNSGMASHYYAMIASFILTSTLIAALILYFQRQVSQREHTLHLLRERQLRDEQLLAIGTAAAQLTHEVATPAQSIRLLLEELMETTIDPERLLPIDTEFRRIEEQLTTWREVSDDVREQRQRPYRVEQVWMDLRRIILTSFPELAIIWRHQETSTAILADATLHSALSSILLNTCEAAKKSSTEVIVESHIENDCWYLQFINDAGAMTEAELKQIGNRLTTSVNGLGVGAIVSNATLERFGGQVRWLKRNRCVQTIITLPLQSDV